MAALAGASLFVIGALGIMMVLVERCFWRAKYNGGASLSIDALGIVFYL
jgi:hypothetical protein